LRIAPILATEARESFWHLGENDVFGPLPTLRDQNGSKFKTLCALMTKISTGALIALSILTLHE
jgi:hypothetical protein